MLINKNLGQLKKDRFDDLINYFLKTAKYSTIFYGQGEFNNVNLIEPNNYYFKDFELIDKDLFFKVFIVLRSSSGLTKEDFILNKLLKLVK